MRHLDNIVGIDHRSYRSGIDLSALKHLDHILIVGIDHTDNTDQELIYLP